MSARAHAHAHMPHAHVWLLHPRLSFAQTCITQAHRHLFLLTDLLPMELSQLYVGVCCRMRCVCAHAVLCPVILVPDCTLLCGGGEGGTWLAL